MSNQEEKKDGFALMLEAAMKDKDNPEMAMKWVIELVNTFSEFAIWVNGYTYANNEKVHNLEGDVALLDSQVGEIMDDDFTRITPEHAEKFLKLIESFRWMITEALKEDQSLDGKAKLDELTILANECDAIVQEGIMEDDEEEPGDTISNNGPQH